jgi:hypothetical protein
MQISADQKGYIPCMFYDDVINKAKKFKSKCYNLTTIVHSLRQVCFAKNIHNLLIQLERWTYG